MENKYHLQAALVLCFTFFFIAIGIGINSGMNYELALYNGACCFGVVLAAFAVIITLSTLIEKAVSK